MYVVDFVVVCFLARRCLTFFFTTVFFAAGWAVVVVVVVVVLAAVVVASAATSGVAARQTLTASAESVEVSLFFMRTLQSKTRANPRYWKVATTGAWSLVPVSRSDGHDTARFASDSLAST